ncbi:hypothetical protein [Streptomyces sp. CA2R101]|uniref:hypothetical protein n=1 Tax=Streptomyces sp. CA2R101 TaxID=3120152 RepID=UPI00300918CF
MGKHPPLCICPPAGSEGRPVLLGGAALGVAYSSVDLQRLLRQAGIDDELIGLDDEMLSDFEGGGPDVWD